MTSGLDGLTLMMPLLLIALLHLVMYLVLGLLGLMLLRERWWMLFCLAGGPVPERGFCLGRGLACFNKVRLGGPKVRRVRARCSDPGDAALVDL